MPTGDFSITIEGHGQHHEGSTDDANYLAERLVTELRGKGHALSFVEFLPGTPDAAQVTGHARSDGLGVLDAELTEPADVTPDVAPLEVLDEPAGPAWGVGTAFGGFSPDPIP